MMRGMPTIVVFALLALAGCAGDPDLVSSEAALDESVGGQLEIDRSRWERATAGCEGADLSSSSLLGCAGEPLLGALMGRDGRVVCVDSLSLLREETRAVRMPTAGTIPDPTPTPVMPLGGYQDPTPTPAIDR